MSPHRHLLANFLIQGPLAPVTMLVLRPINIPFATFPALHRWFYHQEVWGSSTATIREEVITRANADQRCVGECQQHTCSYSFLVKPRFLLPLTIGTISSSSDARTITVRRCRDGLPESLWAHLVECCAWERDALIPATLEEREYIRILVETVICYINK